jgi:hypothetical protein
LIFLQAKEIINREERKKGVVGAQHAAPAVRTYGNRGAMNRAPTFGRIVAGMPEGNRVIGDRL